MGDLEQKTVFKVLITNKPILALMPVEKLKRYTKNTTKVLGQLLPLHNLRWSLIIIQVLMKRFHKNSFILTKCLVLQRSFLEACYLLISFLLDLQLKAWRLWFMEQKQRHVISSATHPPNCRDQTFGANPLNCWENANQEHTCKNQNQFVNKWTCLTVRALRRKRDLIAWNRK